MNHNKKIGFVLTLVLAFSSVIANAGEEREKCKRPRFRSFEPINKSEVEPESEISFHAYDVAGPHAIKVFAKGIPMKVTVENRNLFYVVTGKLPAELKDTYVRVNVKGTALLGCKSQDGVLLKVRDVAGETEQVTTTDEVNTEIKEIVETKEVLVDENQK